MTAEQWVRNQQNQINDFVKCIGVGIQSAHALQSQRIFGDGLDSNGQPIGAYNNTEPLYVNPKNAEVNFPPKGKYGDTKFKNGKSHKTGYFDSYKKFRDNQGRKTDTVNLNYSGLLFSDFSSSLIKQGTSYFTGLRNKANVGKLKGAIEKYGVDTFLLSKEEKQVLNNTIVSCLNRL